MEDCCAYYFGEEIFRVIFVLLEVANLKSFPDLFPFTNRAKSVDRAENVMYVLSWRQTGK